MANMTDQARVNWLMQALFTASTSATWTPGTGGGSALVTHPPYNLRLLSAGGTNVTPGVELATSGGYVANGASLGSVFCAAPVAAVQSNGNLVSWSATGTWATVNAIEIWDTNSTPLRWLQGAIPPISGVVNGDTVQFAIASITLNAQQW